MLSFEQLADTGTADVDAVTREKWAKVVEETAKSKRVFRDLIRFDNSLTGTDGQILHIPRRGVIEASALSEGGTISPTKLSYTEAATLQPSPVGAAVVIGQQASEMAYVNAIKDANYEIGEGLAKSEDVAIAEKLCSGTTNVLYAGGGTAVDDLVAGNVMTPQLFARAKMLLEANNYSADAFCGAPQQMWQLGTTEQFSNAAFFGNREYLQKGEISNYIGVRLATSNNLPSDVNTGTVSYHACVMFDKRKAVCIATKNPMKIETDKDILTQENIIAGVYSYDVEIINDPATVVIYCADE